MSICCLITGGANLDALVEAMSVGFPHCEVTIFAFAITRVVSWKRGFKNIAHTVFPQTLTTKLAPSSGPARSSYYHRARLVVTLSFIPLTGIL